MDDQEFLGYVEIHSQTERALFHYRDIARLLDLAGEPRRAKEFRDCITSNSGMGNFTALQAGEELTDLLSQARKHLS